VSLAYKYGNVEFAGNLTGLGRKSPSGYVLGDPAGGGRLGVATLNLPRLGHEARNEEDFFDRLGALLENAVDALESRRRAVEESLEAGRLPETRRVQGSVEGHRSAITLAGMNEALMSVIDAGVGHVAGKAVTYKVLEFISGRLEEARAEHSHNFSLESYPCVEAGAVLAAMDRQLYGDSYAQGENAPYYTAASELPPGHGDDLWQALDHQKRLHAIYGGATMLEVHLRRGIPLRDECGLLVERIMGQGFGEVKVSPLFSLCPEHGYISGEVYACPVCGRETAAYTWVDGRPRPLGQVSEGLKEAHRQRVSHDVKSA
jgi:ribonucleoside-triphosphate reductase